MKDETKYRLLLAAAICRTVGWACLVVLVIVLAVEGVDITITVK